MARSGRAKAAQIGIKIALAIVEGHGDLVLLERMDGASSLSVTICQSKARTSSALRRSGNELLELAQSNTIFWSGVTTLTKGEIIFGKGGATIKKGGEFVGAIGVSGGTGEQDELSRLASIQRQVLYAALIDHLRDGIAL